jgi:branched-chain amino acid transport system substrate-binding protein
MVNKKIIFMHGHWCSSSTIPASEVYNEANIPVVTVSTNPQVTERGLKNIFAIAGRDDQQGQVAGAYLAEKFKGKKIAVVDDKSAYGKGLADEVAKAMEAKGVKPALRESITAGEKDYSGLVSKLKSSGVEVMSYGGYHTEVALILRQAQQAGLKLTVMGGDTMSNTELATAAGPRPNNVLFTFGRIRARTRVPPPSSRSSTTPRSNRKATSSMPTPLSSSSTRRRPRPRAPSTPTSRKRCVSGSFDTVIGKLSFDAKGNSSAPAFVVYQWKDGKYDYVKK